MGDNNDPIVSDTPAPGLSAWLRDAVAAMRGKGPDAPPAASVPVNDPNATVSDAEPRPAAKAVKAQAWPVPETTAEAAARPPRPPKPGRPFPSSPRPQSPDEARKDVHGAPAIWMAPFFLALAVVFILPFLAGLLTPHAPRETIDGLVHRLPSWARLLSPMMAGWLWAPWYVAAPAFLLHLRGAWITGVGMLDAVGWGTSAWALEGAAWLFRGRTTLTAGGFSAAEQKGCWQLLAVEFLFLLLTATMFGPTRRRWVRFEQ